jgi:uncharacterized iron-regulated membrane protein
MNNKFKRLLFSIHSWFGLITGVFLLLLGLSGSVLVFQEELDELIYHKTLTVKPEAKALPIDSLYKIITNKYPNLDGIAWINPTAEKDQSYHFRLYLNDARLESYDLGAININQYTGEILRSGRSDDLEVGWIVWIFQFHFSFHLGMPGAALTAIFGLTMLISMMTGFIVYRKFIWKVLTFKVKMKTNNWRMLSSDLHRVVGVWSLLLNVIVFFTGFWMNLFAFESETWKKETIPTPNNILVKASLDKMYAESLLKMPDLVPSYVYLPTQPEKKFSVRGNLKDQNPMFAGGNVVSFDTNTGEFLSTGRFDDLAFWDKVEALFFPLHVGNYGGIPVKILYVILGLTPGLLSITGFLLWWRRKFAKPKTI